MDSVVVGVSMGAFLFTYFRLSGCGVDRLDTTHFVTDRQTDKGRHTDDILITIAKNAAKRTRKVRLGFQLKSEGSNDEKSRIYRVRSASQTLLLNNLLTRKR